MAHTFIGVGSNIDPQSNIREALIRLAERVEIRALSTFYQSRPVGPPGQPPFVNGVVAADTDLPPLAVKRDVLRRIEEGLGRVRTTDKYAPRVIDLDLLIYDDMVADAVTEREEPDSYDDVKEIEAMGSDEKWAFFADLIKDCTRCYACRNACPLCYCPTCFVDESDPQWVGKSLDPTDTMTFHLLRAYHCTGRCTDCGACQNACPVDINVRLFTRKVNKDVLDLYNSEAGLSIEERPPLDTYKPDDDDNFII